MTQLQIFQFLGELYFRFIQKSLTRYSSSALYKWYNPNYSKIGLFNGFHAEIGNSTKQNLKKFEKNMGCMQLFLMSNYFEFQSVRSLDELLLQKLTGS